MTNCGEIYAPTVQAEPNFNAVFDCQDLRKAMKGLGTDEAALINILCHRSWLQRQEIKQTYQQMYGKSLVDSIDSETSGNFREVLKRLLKTPIELAASELHKAIKGIGTDEECLVEIICTKSNEELRAIEITYQELYGKSLEKDISGDTSGYFRRLLIALLACNRPGDVGKPDWIAASIDARSLYEAGEKRAGTDETRFVTVLCSRSYSQLQAIFQCYSREFKHDIDDVIKSEFSRDIAKALLAVVDAVRNRPAYFAKRFHAAMSPWTNAKRLTRLVVSRCDFDLDAIKAEYERLYGRPLSKDIHNETSGDFRKALMAILGHDFNITL